MSTQSIEPANRTFVRAASLDAIPQGSRMTVNLDGHVIALFHTPEGIFAVDNRCPHMGFPLDRGTVKDCILTCHWHHARFDLHSGGAFDPWADDVRAFPVKVEGGDIWIDLAPRGDSHRHRVERLRDGIERNLSLVIGKSVIAMLDDTGDAREPFRIGLEFGTHYRRDGWGAGLTTLTCMMNLLPHLRAEDRARAMFHGLCSVANDSDGHPPRFEMRPLPGGGASIAEIKRWLRRFVEVRDTEGAERCIVSAVRTGAAPREVADMMFAAATDHRYLDGGHTLDFTNKAFEALDHAGWDLAEPVLASLARGYATGDRMEESNSWRNPVDLVTILETAFEAIPDALDHGQRARGLLERSRRTGSCSPRRRSDCYRRRDDRRVARRMRARGSRWHRGVCCVASDRALPDQQRVRRLGYRPSQLHLCQRRSSVGAPGRIGGIGAWNFRRCDDCLPRSISQRSGRQAA